MRTKLILAAVLAVAATVGTGAQAQQRTLLFKDTFNTTTPSDDINALAGASQSGPLAPLTYTSTADGVTNLSQIGQPDAPNQLKLTAGNGVVMVSPDHNFTEGSNFSIDFDVDPGVNDTADSSTDWAAIIFGAGNETMSVNASDGMGILFRDNGALQVFDGAASVYAGTGDLTIPTNGLFHVHLEVAAAGFAGSPATVKLFINGQQARLSASSLEYYRPAGFDNNFITLAGYAAAGNQWVDVFDNLEVDAAGCADFLTHEFEARAGDVLNPTVQIPPSLVSNGPVTVTVTARNPGVATLAGAVSNQLALTFTSAGPFTNQLTLNVVGSGAAKFDLTVGSGGCVGQPLMVTAGGSFVRNPSFEKNYAAAWPHYGAIDDWTTTGGAGVNDVSGPFWDNGLDPDQGRVAFLQGAATMTQTLSRLNPTNQYWLQYFYNARTASAGTSLEIDVSFAGNTLDTIPNVVAVGTGKPFAFRNVPFIPGTDTGDLMFFNNPSGDVTSLFDAICVVARSTNEVVLMNPSFEASGVVAAPGYLTNLAGWTVGGQAGVNFGGAGPFADNGTTPDQDNVAFIEGAGSLSQQVRGLVSGTSYTLAFAYNARSTNSPHLQVKANNTVLFDQVVAPVGGSNPYHSTNITFRLTNDTVLLTFAQTSTNDQTVLLDDIHLVGQSSALPCLIVQPDQTELTVGGTDTITVTVPPGLIASSSANIKLGSANPKVAALVGADASGALVLPFTAGGVNTATCQVTGVGPGTTTLTVLDAAGLCINNGVSVTVVGSYVRNPSFEDDPLPPGVGNAPISAWTSTGGTTGINSSAGPFADNGLIPDGKQVAKFSSNGTGPQSNSLLQGLTGLQTNLTYWLQFRYNVRNCCGGPTIDLAVNFAGNPIGSFPGITPVGGTNEYYYGQVAFTPAASAGELEFATTTTGDATFLLDAVTLVQRDPSQIVIQNPSFEASGRVASPGYLQPNPMSGWVASTNGNYGVNVSGMGPFADNGVNPDQDNVAFLQGQAWLSQTVDGLTAGQNYTLTFAVNARSGNTPHLRVSVDGTVWLDQNITAVGGTNAYWVKSVVFPAASTNAVIKLEQTVPGDQTLLLDNVMLTAGGTVPPTLVLARQTDGTLHLSWPVAAAGFTLQSSSKINGGWATATETVTPQGPQNVAVVTPTGAAKFYRLVK